MSDLQSIRLDEFIPHAPARVWHALTTSDMLARWLMPNDFRLERGHRFTFQRPPLPNIGFDGRIACEVLDFEPERVLRISWIGGGLDTTVTWRLTPEGTGTRLFLEHAGFDLDNPANVFAFQGMQGGWQAMPGRIAALLAGKPVPVEE